MTREDYPVIPVMRQESCPFCSYAGPSPILRDTGDAIVFEPLNPVVPGHVLVVPTAHAEDWVSSPLLSARTMKRAAEYAAIQGFSDCNLIASKGTAATQSVRHLHLHIVPRHQGDGLTLPWTLSVPNDTKPYDSRPDTREHIEVVRGFLWRVIGDLERRAYLHDKSKLESPEVEVFNEFTPKLRDSTYGSEEYKGFLEAMGEGLRHHYAENDHHPEHWPNGIAEMGLLELTEMLCDWLAATQRHADGDIRRSIEQNAERFGYGEEIKRLLLNSLPALED